MMHTTRRWQVVDVRSTDELADKLTDFTWTLCTAFRCEGALFLNDSFGENGAQEYTVVRDGRQIDSITFSWCSRDEAYDHICGVVQSTNETYPGGAIAGAVVPKLDEPSAFRDHRCQLCM